MIVFKPFGLRFFNNIFILYYFKVTKMVSKLDKVESRIINSKVLNLIRSFFAKKEFYPGNDTGEELVSSLEAISAETVYHHSPSDIELKSVITYSLERLPPSIWQYKSIEFVTRDTVLKRGLEGRLQEGVVKSRQTRYFVENDKMYIETKGESQVIDFILNYMFVLSQAKKICGKIYDMDVLNSNGKSLSGNLKDKKGALTRILAYDLAKELPSLEKEDQRKLEVIINNPEIVLSLGKFGLQMKKEPHGVKFEFDPTIGDIFFTGKYEKRWADNIAQVLEANNLKDKPIIILAGNTYSIYNSLYYAQSSKDKGEFFDKLKSLKGNESEQKKILTYALKHGFIDVPDSSGTMVNCHIYDTSKIQSFPSWLNLPIAANRENCPVIIAYDFPFGDQADSILEELLKSIDKVNSKKASPVKGIIVLGKAGSLGKENYSGNKGDIILPDGYVMEQTSECYPINNMLKESDFRDCGLKILKGNMLTVHSTLLQNRPMLESFKVGHWNTSGIDMEGTYSYRSYNKGIMKGLISNTTQFGAVYYSSDGPLNNQPLSTLGHAGISYVYEATFGIMRKIFQMCG